MKPFAQCGILSCGSGIPPSHDMEGGILALRTVLRMFARHAQQTRPRHQHAVDMQIATTMQAWVGRANYGLILVCEK